MTPDTLHTHLRTVIEERLTIARAAGRRGSEWVALTGQDEGRVEHDGVDIFPVVYAEGFPMLDEANHIALHDPADAVRRYEADLRRLERHAPENDWCDISSWPCWEIQDLAASLGIEVSE